MSNNRSHTAFYSTSGVTGPAQRPGSVLSMSLEQQLVIYDSGMYNKFKACDMCSNV